MTIEFKLTEKDQSDAVLAVMQRRNLNARLPWLMHAILYGFGGASCIVYFVCRARTPGVSLLDEPVFADLLIPMSPWLFVLLWSHVAFRMQNRIQAQTLVDTARAPARINPSNRNLHANENRRKVNGAFAHGLWAAIALFVFLTERRPTGASFMLVPFICWNIYLLSASILNQEYARASGRRAIAVSRHFAESQRIDATSDRFVMHGFLWRSEIDWRYFPDWFETPTAFLLYISTETYWVIPKRAFSSESETSTFRQLLDANVGLRPSAFPVVPIATSSAPPMQARD